MPRCIATQTKNHVGAREIARRNGNHGELYPNGRRVIRVEMDEFVGFDRSGRKTKFMTIIMENGQYTNAFPGKVNN